MSSHAPAEGIDVERARLKQELGEALQREQRLQSELTEARTKLQCIEQVVAAQKGQIVEIVRQALQNMERTRKEGVEEGRKWSAEIFHQWMDAQRDNFFKDSKEY